ncbi:hypothetical protein [Vulcanisaeta sp. JCM 16159]|uniref:hypothetical protein n=1 Tax=Vulcanisaeta sp. JCM 16159 TaxID=1295371 RepID=UPI001FB320E7|nr:hypothetical protein [Vulcanisaeta sp. JCM 16159]
MNSPINCMAQWVMQYQVIVEDVISGLGSSTTITEGTYWVDKGGSFSINALNYKPNNSNPIIPLAYSHAVIQTSTGSSTTSSSVVSLSSINGPTTIELVWNYNLVNVIGLGAGVALLGLGIAYRDKVRYVTTMIIRRATTMVRRGGSEPGTAVRGVAEDGTRVYAQSSEELPVRPIEEGTRVRQEGTVVRSGESTVVRTNEEKEDAESSGQQKEETKDKG